MHGLSELTRRRVVIGFVVILAALGGLYFLVPKLAGLSQTWGQLEHGDALLLVFAGVLELLSIAGYALLFGAVFGRGVIRINWRVSLEIPLAGIAAIRLLAAGGAGAMAVTVWALRRAGMEPAVIACRMVASYVIQYSLYLAAILVCGLGLWYGVFPGGGSFGLTVIPAFLSAGVLALVLSMALVPRDCERRLVRMARRSGRIGRLAARCATAPATVGAGVRTAIGLVRDRPVAVLGAAAYWAFDIAVLGLCFEAFGERMPLAVLVVGYFIGTLGSLLPLPGGIGGVEGGMIGAFVAFGVPGGRAVVGVLAYRAISFWLPTIPGIAGYLRLRSRVRGWPPAGKAMSERSGWLASIGRALLRAVRWAARRLRGEVVRRVGGPARARVIVMFAAVLALNGADTATIGAVAPQLEHALRIGDTKIGLLSSVTLLVGAVFTIPVGLLVDRSKRMPLLSLSIVLWSFASLFSAFAGSYSSLLLTRLVLGAVVATAGPAIASLTGDYFPAADRGRIWAYILGGEVAGTAMGFILCGSVASLIDWRAAFVLLAVPGFFLARELWRTVPEPLRGGQSHLEPGALDLEAALAAATARAEQGLGSSQDEDPSLAHHEAAREAAQRAGATPSAERVLHEDARQIGLVRSVRYILSVPTNVLMIVGSSLGYFYLAGLQTFALLFVKGHYRVSQATAELVLALLVGGALIGTLVGGRVSDVLVRRGMLAARVWIPAGCYLGAAVVLVPAFLGNSLTPALWFVVAGAALLAAANPPAQAARLDIMPAGLWGRAESVRTFVRSVAQALAPLVFGGLADLIAGIVPSQAPIGTHPNAPSSNTATGLQISFLIMLASLVAGGIFLARARRTYATDVATAAASEQAP